MTKLNELAKTYEVKTTKNISELVRVPVDIETSSETFTDKEGKEFSVNIIEVESEKYRVPNSVLEQLKTHLENQPALKFFKVIKKGSELNTRYTVVPLMDTK